MALPFRVAVHIGYHKTATTWFQEVAFNHHPEVVPVPKYPVADLYGAESLVRAVVMEREGDFDAARVRRGLVEEAFDRCPDPGGKTVIVSAERLSGHPASGSYDVHRIADRLSRVVPEARIVCLLRDRVSSLRSAYSQLVLEGWTGTPMKTLATPFSRRGVGFDVCYWEYERVLDAYAARFGREALYVGDYGRFATDPSDLLAELARFLGIRPWDLASQHFSMTRATSAPVMATRVRRLLNYARRTEHNPYPLFTLPRGLRRMLVRVARHLPPGPPLFGHGLEEWVSERFAASDERLARDYGLRLMPHRPHSV